MNSLDKLNLAIMMFAEPVLFIGLDIIMIKMLHRAAIQDIYIWKLSRQVGSY